MNKIQEFDGYYNKYLKVELIEDGVILSVTSENYPDISVTLDSEELENLREFLSNK